MGQVIGDLLPLAVGVAISPIPIIAVILMLLAPRAGGTTAGFLLGWVLGIALACTVFLLLARQRMAAPLDALKVWLTANNTAVMSVLMLVIGFVLVGKGLGGLL